MTLLPHTTLMWAVIGVYTGREDDIFWRESATAGTARWKRRARAPSASGTRRPWSRRHPFGDQPIPRLTGAIHVYGGDFFAVARSEWDAETLLEAPSEGAKMACRLDEANALFLKS